MVASKSDLLAGRRMAIWISYWSLYILLMSAIKIVVGQTGAIQTCGNGCNVSETCAKWNLTYKGVATSLALGDLCYTFWGDYTKILTFNEGYDFCSSARQAWFPGTTGFDYGRLAVFQTPDMFKCVLESAATYTSSHYIMIGAHNRNGTANVLTDFLWGRTDRTDDGCNISNAFGKTNGKTVAPGPMVLVADVTRWVLEPHSENDVWYLPVFCEFGCGPPPMWPSTPAWDIYPSLPLCNMAKATADATRTCSATTTTSSTSTTTTSSTTRSTTSSTTTLITTSTTRSNSASTSALQTSSTSSTPAAQSTASSVAPSAAATVMTMPNAMASTCTSTTTTSSTSTSTSTSSTTSSSSSPTTPTTTTASTTTESTSTPTTTTSTRPQQTTPALTSPSGTTMISTTETAGVSTDMTTTSKSTTTSTILPSAASTAYTSASNTKMTSSSTIASTSVMSTSTAGSTASTSAFSASVDSTTTSTSIPSPTTMVDISTSTATITSTSTALFTTTESTSTASFTTPSISTSTSTSTPSFTTIPTTSTPPSTSPSASTTSATSTVTATTPSTTPRTASTIATTTSMATPTVTASTTLATSVPSASPSSRISSAATTEMSSSQTSSAATMSTSPISSASIVATVMRTSASSAAITSLASTPSSTMPTVATSFSSSFTSMSALTYAASTPASTAALSTVPAFSSALSAVVSATPIMDAITSTVEVSEVASTVSALPDVQTAATSADTPVMSNQAAAETAATTLSPSGMPKNQPQTTAGHTSSYPTVASTAIGGTSTRSADLLASASVSSTSTDKTRTFTTSAMEEQTTVAVSEASSISSNPTVTSAVTSTSSSSSSSSRRRRTSSPAGTMTSSSVSWTISDIDPASTLVPSVPLSSPEAMTTASSIAAIGKETSVDRSSTVTSILDSSSVSRSSASVEGTTVITNSTAAETATMPGLVTDVSMAMLPLAATTVGSSTSKAAASGITGSLATVLTGTDSSDDHATVQLESTMSGMATVPATFMSTSLTSTTPRRRRIAKVTTDSTAAASQPAIVSDKQDLSTSTQAVGKPLNASNASASAGASSAVTSGPPAPAASAATLNSVLLSNQADPVQPLFASTATAEALPETAVSNAPTRETSEGMVESTAAAPTSFADFDDALTEASDSETLGPPMIQAVTGSTRSRVLKMRTMSPTLGPIRPLPSDNELLDYADYDNSSTSSSPDGISRSPMDGSSGSFPSGPGLPMDRAMTIPNSQVASSATQSEDVPNWPEYSVQPVPPSVSPGVLGNATHASDGPAASFTPTVAAAVAAGSPRSAGVQSATASTRVGIQRRRTMSPTLGSIQLLPPDEGVQDHVDYESLSAVANNASTRNFPNTIPTSPVDGRTSPSMLMDREKQTASSVVTEQQVPSATMTVNPVQPGAASSPSKRASPNRITVSSHADSATARTLSVAALVPTASVGSLQENTGWPAQGISIWSQHSEPFVAAHVSNSVDPPSATHDSGAPGVQPTSADPEAESPLTFFSASSAPIGPTASKGLGTDPAVSTAGDPTFVVTAGHTDLGTDPAKFTEPSIRTSAPSLVTPSGIIPNHVTAVDAENITSQTVGTADFLAAPKSRRHHGRPAASPLSGPNAYQEYTARNAPDPKMSPDEVQNLQTLAALSKQTVTADSSTFSQLQQSEMTQKARASSDDPARTVPSPDLRSMIDEHESAAPGQNYLSQSMADATMGPVFLQASGMTSESTTSDAGRLIDIITPSDQDPATIIRSSSSDPATGKLMNAQTDIPNGNRGAAVPSWSRPSDDPSEALEPDSFTSASPANNAPMSAYAASRGTIPPTYASGMSPYDGPDASRNSKATIASDDISARGAGGTSSPSWSRPSDGRSEWPTGAHSKGFLASDVPRSSFATNQASAENFGGITASSFTGPNVLGSTKQTSNDTSESEASRSAILDGNPAVITTDRYARTEVSAKPNAANDTGREYESYDGTVNETSTDSLGQPEDDRSAKHPPPDPMTPLERTVTQVMHSLGCVWIIGCGSACFVLGSITDFRSPDRQLLASQELSLTISHLLVFLWHDATANEVLCTTVAVLIQYFTLAYYSFLFLDSVRNLVIVVAFINTTRQVPVAYMQLAGWGAPLLWVAMSTALYYKEYGSDYSCWLNLGHPIARLTTAPVVFISALTVIMAESAGVTTPCRPHIPALHQSYITALVGRDSLFIILPLSLCSWALGFSSVYYQRMEVYTVVCGLNIALGVTLVIFHIPENGKVRTLVTSVWKKAWRRIRG